MLLFIPCFLGIIGAALFPSQADSRRASTQPRVVQAEPTSDVRDEPSRAEPATSDAQTAPLASVVDAEPSAPLLDVTHQLHGAQAKYARWLQENPKPIAPEVTEHGFMDSTGEYPFVGDVLQINETHVQLQRKSGEKVTVERSRLSEFDQNFLSETFADYLAEVSDWKTSAAPLLAEINSLKEAAEHEAEEAEAHIAQLYEPIVDKSAKVLVGQVARVLDGDTIQINDIRSGMLTVRLLGIDAPEESQRFGPEATHWLENHLHLGGKELVRIEYNERDRYSRLLGNVYRGDLWLNREIVRNGLAWHYVKYSKNIQLQKAQNVARNASLGIWADARRVAPWDYRNGVRVESSAPRNVASTRDQGPFVYITEHGHKYHRATCRHLAKSKQKIPLSRASGYEPCKHCRP
ncbi:MAG: hypothetical protein Aurels2KO_57320 [Aureliella sp.]